MQAPSVTLSPGVRKLLERANFASLATVMPDGAPQVTPVWVDIDGERVLVNTAEGRVKERNVRRDPRVALCVYNQENPYSMAAVRGRVVEITREGADEHIDKLAKKYLGVERYPYHREGEQRVILVIAPERVTSIMTD